ncbi:MAG: NADH-quinone oxidoreductase subunit A [bacterium]
MDKTALLDLIYVMAFLAGGLVLGIAPMILALILAPRKTRSHAGKTLEVIECGVPGIGSTWIRYGVVYYLYALIFVAFAVDVLFLFPVAVIYNTSPGWTELFEFVLFVGILALVIVYAWMKGVFTWTSKLKSPRD